MHNNTFEHMCLKNKKTYSQYVCLITMTRCLPSNAPRWCTRGGRSVGSLLSSPPTARTYCYYH